MQRLLVSSALVGAFAACILVLLCLPMLPGVMPKTSRIWKGYHTLLIRDGAVGQDLVRQAFQRLGPGVISEETALVSYSDLEGGAFSTYAELPTRLDPGDPRFDPFMRALHGYFRTSGRKAEWRIAYIPACWTRTATFRRLVRQLGPASGGGWRLVEYDPLEKTLVLTWATVFSVIASLSLRKAPRRRDGELPALAIACMLCWFPFLATGGIAELCFVAAVFPAWVRLARERRTLFSSAERGGRGGAGEALATYTAALAIALALLLLVGGFSWFRLAGTLAGAACTLLLLAIRAPLGQLARRWNRKRAFAPVPALHRRIGSLRLPAAATFPFAAAPLLLAVIPFLRPPLLPVPSPVAGLRDFSWRSVAELSARRQSAVGTVVPDMSDAVAHSAYQQALVFGRPYGFPAADERVTVTEYIENPATGIVVPRQRTVRTFDSAWLARLTRAPPSPSVEELLLAQERPVTVRHGRGRSPFIRDLLAAVLCGLALLGWFAHDAGLRPLIRERFWRFTTPALKKHSR